MSGSIDQWLDWGDHTVTVDPIGNKKWILESDTEGHSQSINRKRRFDADNVRELIGWQNRHVVGPPSLFEPVVDGLPLYSEPIGKGCKQWRGQVRDPWRFGKLPVVTQLIRDRAFNEKSTGEIKHEMREVERRRDVWSVHPIAVPAFNPNDAWNIGPADPLNVVA